MTEIRRHFYFDQAGDPRARCDPPHERLGHFLESDVQTSKAFCRDILAAIDNIFAHKLTRWQQTGNAHTLILRAHEARIEAEFDDTAEPCILSLEELRHAVAGWLEFLEHQST